MKHLFDLRHLIHPGSGRYSQKKMLKVVLMSTVPRVCPHTPSGAAGRLPCIYCCLSDALAHTASVPSNVVHLIEHIHERLIPKGQIICREGDHARTLTILNHGVVKLTQTLANGQQRIVRLLHSGDILGLESLVNHRSRHTATTVTDTRLCELPTSLITELEKLDPHVYERLMEQWQRSLDEADSFITELSTGTAEARLARLLIKLSEGTEASVFPALSREEIGSIIGISTETASRMMARFKREALIQERGDQFSHCAVDALTRIAED